MRMSGTLSRVLLRFGLHNHTSFRDATELSFVSTAQADWPTWRMEAPSVPHGALPVVGVWGANASGKSNLLRALEVFRNLVRDSFLGLTPEEPIPWQPFAMRRQQDDPSTHMDVDVVVDGVRHHYGMRFRATGFVEEWLYAWPKHRKQVLFHRNHEETDPWYFGPSLGGQRQHIARATRANSLFLSAAAQYNHEQLMPVYTAITQGIRSERRIELRGYPLFEASSLVLEPRFAATVLAFLAAADLGVVGMRSTELPLSRSEELLAKPLQPQAGKPRLFELRLRHGAAEDASWELPPDLESRGTQILLRRLEDFLEALRDGGLLLLDELDTSLHPDLCAELVGLFADPDVNRRQAQLLFSTHDRNLLGVLRRDEVIMVDKARDGASSLRAASDYADVRARDDLRRAHELGRIHGVPILGDFAGAITRALDLEHAP
jgi:uncharacterized protein